MIKERLVNSIESVKGLEKPVIGWFCGHLPEELIYAAGAHPFRITGIKSSGIKKTDTYLPNFFCPYAASCLDGALNGEYDFLDGVVFTGTCNAMQKVYDIWKEKVGTKAIYMLDTPRIRTKESERFYLSEIGRLKNWLEDSYGNKVTTERLSAAIESYNVSRQLLKEICALVKEGRTTLSLTDHFRLVKGCSYNERERVNSELKALLKELQAGEQKKMRGKKIVLAGGILDNFELIDMIEECGAKVAADALSSGSGYYDKMVDKGEAPLEALSRHYLYESPCPGVKGSGSLRAAQVKELVEQTDADGVIFYSLKFCIGNSYDGYAIKESLKEEGIPTLLVEGDYTMGGLEQIKTRIQAFIEIL